MTNPLRDARDRVLAETNAQEVLKNLDELEDRRTAFRSRWVWELVQNARDAAPAKGVSITFTRTDGGLSVRHDGRPFEFDSIAHLVYHGSTKIEAEDEVGRFGTGFLSTHLLSRVVHVRGCLADGRRFAFTLDRSGTTVEAVGRGMDRSWQNFEQSVSVDGEQNLTEFEYPLSDAVADLVAAGLDDLRRCAPVVLALSPEISAIAVESKELSWHMRRGDPQRLAGDVELVPITHENGTESGRLVAVARSQDVDAALPLLRGTDGVSVDLPDDMARLFILFPLLGSDRLLLPTLVNSRRFKPREARDGVELTGTEAGPTRNRALVNAYVPCGIRLVRAVADHGWGNAQHALGFHTSPPDWVDKDWFNKLIAPMIDEVRNTPLLTTAGGRRISPITSWIPHGADDAVCDAIWALASGVRGSEDKLPRRDDIKTWSRNLGNWARLRGEDASRLQETLTVDRLARMVTSAATVEQLAGQLADSADPFEWLRGLFGLIERIGRTNIFDELALLPSQGGRFRKRSEQLWLDGGIPDSLKKIGTDLSVDLRDHLLDGRAQTPGVERLLSTKSEADVLDQILGDLKRRCQQHRMEIALVPVVAELLGWIAERDRYHDKVDGMPVPTEQTDDKGAVTLALRRDVTPEQRPLAPAPMWPEAAKRRAALFPRSRVIAAALAEGPADHESWVRLARAGYVHLSPLIDARQRIEAFLPDELLPWTEGGKGHRAADDVDVSSIAFLAEPDGGLLEAVRKSRGKAIELIRFLVEFVLEQDQQAFTELRLQCDCGEAHRAFRGSWLVPLRRRAWVPLGTDGRRSVEATAESLALLLADAPDLVSRLTDERGTKLLRALGISSADLALRVVAKDEPSRVSLIRSVGALTQATGGDVERVCKLVDEIREHPEVMQTIEEHRAQREKVQRNQSIGRQVEEVLKAALEGTGLKVRPTGVGSDFEVESDFTENGQEVLLELTGPNFSTLVEVKSSRADRVKMTPRQAKTACTETGRFVLCVVPIGDSVPTVDLVRERSRFVFGIGDQLRMVWDGYEEMREAADSAQEPAGAVQLELVEGQARFCVGEALWRMGAGFADAVARFARQGQPAPMNVDGDGP